MNITIARAKVAKTTRVVSVMAVIITFCWLLAIVAVSGCSKPPSGKDNKTANKANNHSAGENSQSVTGKSNANTTVANTGYNYDPRKDPLVNPPSLFEPAPKDKSKIDSNATLYLQLDGNPNTLNPLFVSSVYDFMVVDALYTGLFSFDKDMKWEVNKDLVESFKESPDHTVFIVKMKKGFTWQDGVPLTAHDVVYSWKEILDPNVPCLTQKPTTKPIKQCIALDDYTVKYVQPEPLATAKWNLSFPIIPKHIFEKDKKNHPDLKTGTFYNNISRHPIGSGAYKLVKWAENDKLILERWDGYKGEKPYFKRIVFRIIPDSNMSLLSFEKQRIDVIRALSAMQFARETNNEDFSRVGYKAWGKQWSFSYIGWNMDGSNPFFKDKRVRLAMTHALNIPLIVDKVFYNLATQCHGIYNPDAWMYNPKIKLLKYDLKKAAALLDEAGWLVDPDDGWRYKNIKGQKVRFEFTLLIPQGSKSSPKIAAIYQQDLKRLGIILNTRVMEWATFLEKVRNHNFQAEIAGWGTGTDPDDGWNLWRTDQYKTGRNYGGYSNPEVDKLFELGRKEFDRNKRKKIYQKIDKILYDDQPYTWIIDAPILAAFNKRIHGVQFSPRGIYNFDPSFDAWWVLRAGSRNTEVMPK